MLESFWPILWIPSYQPFHSWRSVDPLWPRELHPIQPQWSFQSFQSSVFSLRKLKIPSEIEIALRCLLLPLFACLSGYTVQAVVYCLKSSMLVHLMISCLFMLSCTHVLMFVYLMFISCLSHVLIKMLNEWTGWYPLSYYVYVSTCGAKMVYDKGRFPDAGSAHFLLLN